MEDLPAPLLHEILYRLSDAADLARCRVASKILNSIVDDVRSVHLQCSSIRYAKSRSPLTSFSITPFKSVFTKLIYDRRVVERVSIGVENPLRYVSYDDVEGEDEEDDLFLSDVNFVNSWLPHVCGRLKSLSISDFWVQSCWRRSDVLALVSSQCFNLLELEIKNAWLSVHGLSPMMKLTTLTLEFIRLDDENLEKVNECFPLLRVLNLIGVGGLMDPKIHLMHLEALIWTSSNAPLSIKIVTPNLIKLKLKCVKPHVLLIDTPLLSDLHLSLEGAGNFIVSEFKYLTKLHLESTGLRNLLVRVPFGRTVKKLTVVSTKWEVPVGVTKSILELLLCVFPNVGSLTLTPGVWSELEIHPGLEGSEFNHQIQGLREITAYLTVNDTESTVSTIFSILDSCSNLSYMGMLVHRDVVSNITSSLISRCMTYCSKVRWKWGMWKEGTEDVWMSDSI